MHVEKKRKKEKNDLWLKAAVVGGLWASIEIIIGSFLHNARLPFAGTTLAFAGTILLIGFYQVWPHRGLIIRAGFITAIMKSVSPSVIIFGPMTGIMMEAILLELVILVAGNNLISLMLAGAFSLSSALFHKVLNLIIFYGFDLIKVYVNIINFALKQFGLDEANEVDILLSLLGVYFTFGFLAAIIGWHIGKKSLKLRANLEESNWGVLPSETKDFFEIKEDQKTSISLLFVHILSIPFGLYLFNYHGFVGGLFYVIPYVLVFGIKYAYSLRRLRKPVFWSQLVFIVLLSALFWKSEKSSGFGLNYEGFVVGLEMMSRALFIVIAFSALSVELRNQKVKQFLFSIGFGQFYQSIGLAFGALPIMISMLPKSREIFKNPANSLLKPLILADKWLQVFKNEKVNT
jgi:hypothetical protein